MYEKKRPIRSCISCRQKQPKNELIRIVRESNEKVCIDVTGKKSGRGAYLCVNEACINQALRSDSVSKALMLKTFDKKALAAELYKKAGQ